MTSEKLKLLFRKQLFRSVISKREFKKYNVKQRFVLSMLSFILASYNLPCFLIMYLLHS